MGGQGTCRLQPEEAARLSASVCIDNARLQTAGLELSLATYVNQNEKRKQRAILYLYMYMCIFVQLGRELGRIIMISEQAKVFTFDCISFAL